MERSQVLALDDAAPYDDVVRAMISATLQHIARNLG